MKKKILFIVMALVCLITNMTARAAITTNIMQAGYLYDQDNIQNIVRAKVNNNVHIGARVPLENLNELNIIRHAHAEVILRDVVATIPINIGGGHWAALVLKRHNGHTLSIFNDPNGTALVNRAELLQVLERDPNSEIIDLQTRQQIVMKFRTFFNITLKVNGTNYTFISDL
jgi:hypothetical protein